jgi:4-amino-4-deoxy-L-arabinose transferase-like glycosyltransferase
MQSIGIVLRTLLGVPFFLYIPGYILDRIWLDDESRVGGIERHVARVVVSVLLTGWLALLMAEIGFFSYGLLLGCLLALSGCGAFMLRRQGRWPRFERRPPALGIVAGQASTPTGAALRLAGLRFDHALLGVALLFGLLVARPFEVIRGGLDAGVYANTGVAIARTGSIVQHDPIVAEIGQRAAQGDELAKQIESNIFGVQSAKRNIATRLRAAGFFINSGELAQGRVVPQFFHLWPVWIAIFVSMLGPTLGLVATGAFGTLGVVLLGLLGRRIGGPLTGILGALFLALMTPQVWFSRMSTSEALAQALTLAGLWAFTHFADAARRREQIWWGGVVGGTFGALALTRIDCFWVVGPALALLVYVALTRRWHAGYSALALTLGGLLIHTALHTVQIARAYFFDTGYARFQDYALTIHLSLPFLTPELQERFMLRWGSKYQDPWRLPIELGVLAAGGLMLLALWRWPRPLLLIERMIQRQRRWLIATSMVGLGALAIYGYLIRPEILTTEVLRDPLQPQHWLQLQGYIGAPIQPPTSKYCQPDQPCKETLYISLANMVRLGWYLSPLGVALGTIGWLLLWRRLDRRSWFFMLIATIYALFYIRSLYGTSDQTYIYILRRYVPLVYPAFALGIAYALAALKDWQPRMAIGKRLQVAQTGVFVALAVGLLLFFVVTGRTVYAHVEYAGALAQIEALSAQIQDQDIVLVRGGGANDVAVRDTSELIVAPLTYVYGRNVLPVKGRAPAKYPAAFADQVTRWRNEGRRVYLLLAASGSDMLFPGYGLRSIDTWTLQLREFQQLENQKPKLSYTNEVPFHMYELVPTADALHTLSYDDTGAQVAGFYRSEQIEPEQQRAAWTDGMAVLRLPLAAQGQTLTVQVAGGKRPQALGKARLCLDVVAEPLPYPEGGVAQGAIPPDSSPTDVPWRELKCAELDETFQAVQADLPALAAHRPVLVRLRSTTWIPAEVTPEPGAAAAQDQRRLGIRFTSATLTP